MGKTPLKRRIDYFVLIFWIVIFFAHWIQTLYQTESLVESLAFSLLSVMTLYFPSTYLSRTLLPKALKTKKVKVFIIQYVLISILTGYVYVGYFFLFAYLEQRGVFPHSIYFTLGDLPVSTILLAGISSSGFLLNLSMCGLSFLLEYVKSQKVLVGYQLQTLQHQITPHFMFNILNHIHVLMQTDVELASDLLIKYSEILRYQLYNGEKKAITIEQEIQFLKDFIAVEKLRWGERLTVQCHWEAIDKQRKIPSLLFITFVENAFKHVAKSVYEKGVIEIDFRQYENQLKFEIRNTKSMIKPDKIGLGLGLKNIKERLEILYLRKHDLRIDETNDSFYVMLTIQL